MILETNFFYKAFQNALEKCHEHYDVKECLIKAPHYNPGYTTSLSGGSVHPLRDSLNYAVALLDKGEVKYKSRAVDIIDKVLSLQDTKPDSNTYGSWPWYYEELLEKMKSPDLNWADFCGKDLVYLLRDYRDELNKDLVRRIETALYHAASCSMKRDVQPDYTNINLMGTYVGYMAGKLLNNDQFVESALRRLKKAVEYTTFHGGFTEYNSPTYTLIALGEIGRMLTDFSEKEMDYVEILNDYVWKCIAQHYHAPTYQLAPPHARSYIDMESKFFVSFLQAGLKDKVTLISEKDVMLDIHWPRNHFRIELSWPKIKVQCPEKYYHFFEMQQETAINEVFYKGDNPALNIKPSVLINSNKVPQLEARSYMTKEYAFGTFTKCDLWNQRRPLKVFWGDSANFTNFKLRCLKDGKDYSSAILMASQYKNHVIAGVNFVTDYGDTHICLDMVKNAEIETENLILRFETEGINDVLLPDKPMIGERMMLSSGGIKFSLTILCGIFDNENVKIRTGRNNKKSYLDLVMYEGERKKFDFANIQRAIIIFGLSIYSGVQNEEDIRYLLEKEDGFVKAKMHCQSEVIGSISLPEKPCKYIDNLVQSKVM